MAGWFFNSNKIEYTKEILYKGNFAIVFKGRFNGRDVAVKRILVEDADLTKEKREEEFLKKYPHPNILKLLQIEEDENFRFFAFELNASSLQDWADSKYNGPTPTALAGLRQLADGLAHVHNNRHVHRDICPVNISISHGGDRLIISDFGLCKRTNESGSYSVSQQYGHEKWLSPERIENKFNPDVRVTIESDTWAMGCVFYYFLTRGSHPFHDKNLFEMQKNIIAGKINLDSKHELPAASTVIRQMIQRNASHRPKMNNVLMEIDRFPETAATQMSDIVVEVKGQGTDLHLAEIEGMVGPFKDRLKVVDAC